MNIKSLLIVTALTVLPMGAHAQGVNYVDEAGNINFVDSAAQVPVKYRDQVTPPKVVRMSEREYKKYLSEYNKQQKALERERKKQVKLVQKQRKAVMKQRERELLKQQKAAATAEKKQESATKAVTFGRGSSRGSNRELALSGEQERVGIVKVSRD